ncbi:hypothetical protein ID866_8714 [Astraeus odoratus]|nr:hypothetical protein ID866_8714 [Astraeus odoratus]
MSGPDIHPLDRRSLMVMHGANNPGPSNYRDASNGCVCRGSHASVLRSSSCFQRRPARNPYNFTNNLKGTRGNPVASRTVLATPRSSAYPSDHRPSKRSKLESSHVHTRVSPYFSGSTKTERKLLLPPNDSPPHESEPEIHEVQAPVPLRNTRRNDAEIMILDDSCDDIEQPVRTDKTDDSRSSSDPLLIQTPKPPTHPFETRPGQLHADLGQGKSRQVELFNQPVPASESDDEIQSFSSDPPKTSTLKSPAIPNGIVRQRLDKFEKSSVSISSQQSRPGYGVPALHLTDMSKTVVGQMRRKDELVQGIDSLGTSSSGFVDSKRYRKDGNITLPLKTWFLGHREFPRDGNESSKELIYDSRAHTLTVTSGAPPRNFFFRVDRDIDGAEVKTVSVLL